MVERYRIVIDVRTEKQGAFYILQRGESSILEVTRRGRVALYRIEKVILEKVIVEERHLIEARTIG